SSNYLLQITYACRVSMLRWSWARRPRSKIPPPASPEPACHYEARVGRRERWRAGLGPPLEKGEDSRLPVRNPM
ncbi:MAG: hypothetical protein PVF48_14250, partial [Syntrophobacterales bacterium]